MSTVWEKGVSSSTWKVRLTRFDRPGFIHFQDLECQHEDFLSRSF